MWSQKILWFIKLCRLRFLIYSPIMYSIGVSIARNEEKSIDFYLFGIGLIFVWNTHVMTHFFNEFYDYQADCNNKNPSPWTGGSRVLVQKKLSLEVSKLWGYFSCFLSFLILLKIAPNISNFCIGILIIFFGIYYSAPPLKLEYRGLGELVVALVLNILVPLWAYSLYSDNFFNKYVFLLIPISVIEYARMMVMNMPDRESDEVSGKKTLIVRIGLRKAVNVYIILNSLSYVSFLFFFGFIQNNILLTIYLTFPLYAWIAYRFLRGDWKSKFSMYNIPFLASTHNGFVAAAYLFGLNYCYVSFKIFDFLMYPIFLFLFSFVLFNTKLFFNREVA